MTTFLTAQGRPATRRGLLRGSAALAALGTGLTAPALALPVAPMLANVDGDPVLALYGRYRAIQAIQEPISQRTEALRATLSARWGEPSHEHPIDELCGGDPDLAELRRLNDERDGLGEDLYDLGEEMMETPATTSAGLVAKLRLGLEFWHVDRSEDGYHERAAFAFMTDAVRLLEAGRG